MRPGVAVYALADWEQATHAAAMAMERIAGEHAARGWEVEVLRGPEATPEALREAVARLDPALVVGEGHGSPEVFTLQDRRVALALCRGSWIAGRAVFLQSCEAGARLGPDLVAKGVYTFIGYRSDFLWIQFNPHANPLDDAAGRLFWEPVRRGLLALAAGASTGEAVDAIKAGMEESMERARRWEDPAAPLALAYLANNHEGLVSLGSQSLRLAAPGPRLPRPAAAPGVPAGNAALALLPALLLVGVVWSAEA